MSGLSRHLWLQPVPRSGGLYVIIRGVPPKRPSLAFDPVGQTGPPRSNDFFFGAADDTCAARTSGRTSGRTPEHFCDAIFLKKFLRLSPDQRSFLTKIRTVQNVMLLFITSQSSSFPSSFLMHLVHFFLTKKQ